MQFYIICVIHVNIANSSISISSLVLSAESPNVDNVTSSFIEFFFFFFRLPPFEKLHHSKSCC